MFNALRPARSWRGRPTLPSRLRTATYIYIYTYTHVCVYMYIYIYIYVYKSICMCVYLSLSLYIYIYVYSHIVLCHIRKTQQVILCHVVVRDMLTVVLSLLWAERSWYCMCMLVVSAQQFPEPAGRASATPLCDRLLTQGQFWLILRYIIFVIY